MQAYFEVADDLENNLKPNIYSEKQLRELLGLNLHDLCRNFDKQIINIIISNYIESNKFNVIKKS